MSLFSVKPDFIIQDHGVSTVEKISIGGIDQYILIQGEGVQNPILLFIHGGPSMPIPGVSSKGRDYVIATNTKELVKHSTVVFWDQRGTGKSYHSDIPPETMNIQQFISDANEITDYLRDKFNKEKIFLVGHSWGSIIGFNLANKYPEKFHSYVGISQVISWSENDKLSLEWAKKEAIKRGNKKALQELESVGDPPYVASFAQWGVLRKWQAKFNSMIYKNKEKNIKPPSLIQLLRGILASKEYTIKDLYNAFYKGFKLAYQQKMIEDFSVVQFQQSVTKVEFPITFIHGLMDVHVHGELVEDYYRNLEAVNGKRLLWMDKSSHMFHPDDTKLIEKHLIEEIQIHSNQS